MNKEYFNTLIFMLFLSVFIPNSSASELSSSIYGYDLFIDKKVDLNIHKSK
jgi:hypothetical protein